MARYTKGHRVQNHAWSYSLVRDSIYFRSLEKDCLTKSHRQSPNFMAFFPASSTYPGMLGELYSGAFTAAAFNWLCSPAITELETIVLDWLATLFNLPSGYLSAGKGGGVIQGTASEAIVTMVVVARDRYLKESTDHLEGEAKEEAIAHKRGRLVALGSSMAHSSTQKAAQIAGTRFKSIPVTMEEELSMRGPALRKVLEECKQQGLEPYYLTATLGSTGTCAVDNFEEIESVLKEHPHIWTHVDAAYAGAALVCEEYHHLTKCFHSFDSFNMNMHKWLLTNFDASCLWVQRRRHLIDALSITPSYLQNDFSDSGLVTDYRDWQIPLGRRFRALKIWFVLRTYGIEGLKSHIRGHIRIGRVFHSLVSSRSDLFNILTPPAFALTVFNIVMPVRKDHIQPNATDPCTDGDESYEQVNKITKTVYELVNSRGEIYLTSTVLNGIYSIRVVSANPKAEEKYLRRAFDILVSTTEEVLGHKSES
jgi:aromatic-L-amino-acid decarboxylase